MNPARSFGPCVVTHEFPVYHWIYWLGPALGTLIAVVFYRFVKVLEYETANPGQDFNEKEADNFEFDEENAAGREDVTRPTPLSPSEIGAVLSSSRGSQFPGDGGRVSSPTGRGMSLSPVARDRDTFESGPDVERGPSTEA